MHIPGSPATRDTQDRTTGARAVPAPVTVAPVGGPGTEPGQRQDTGCPSPASDSHRQDTGCKGPTGN